MAKGKWEGKGEGKRYLKMNINQNQFSTSRGLGNWTMITRKRTVIYFLFPISCAIAIPTNSTIWTSDHKVMCPVQHATYVLPRLSRCQFLLIHRIQINIFSFFSLYLHSSFSLVLGPGWHWPRAPNDGVFSPEKRRFLPRRFPSDVNRRKRYVGLGGADTA